MGTNRAQLRSELTQHIHEAQRQLVERYGFQQYRQNEWLQPATLRHVRMGYASDEWTITLGDFPVNGYNGVAQMRMPIKGVIRLDTRSFELGKPMPTVQELLTLVQQQ